MFKLQETKKRAKKNKLSLAKQKLLEIHCLAEKIIDEIEMPRKNKHTPLRVSDDYVMKQACEILDIALS